MVILIDVIIISMIVIPSVLICC